jgi:hypothetical protein
MQEAETSWSGTGSKTTAAFDVLNGNLLVACTGASDWSSGAMTVSDSSGLTWTVQQSIAISARAYARVVTAPVTSDISGMTVTFTKSGSSGQCGGNVMTFSEAAVGASNSANLASGTPSVALTTTEDNSVIVVFNLDDLAKDGSSRVWRVGAGALTEQTYYTDGVNWTVYVGYHADSGVIAAQTLGLTAPIAQQTSVIALELIYSAPPPVPEQTDLITLTAAA